MEEFLTGLLFGMVLVILVGGVILITQETDRYNDDIAIVTDQVFTQINHNTTNREILETINKECNSTTQPNRCVSDLKKTFVIDSRGH